jgi:hypothetical protein
MYRNGKEVTSHVNNSNNSNIHQEQSISVSEQGTFVSLQKDINSLKEVTVYHCLYSPQFF